MIAWSDKLYIYLVLSVQHNLELELTGWQKVYLASVNSNVPYGIFLRVIWFKSIDSIFFNLIFTVYLIFVQV